MTRFLMMSWRRIKAMRKGSVTKAVSPYHPHAALRSSPAWMHGSIPPSLLVRQKAMRT